jgi:hypothetical protein
VVKNLVAHHADPSVKGARGFTAVDTAMGRADGHGRGGSDKIVDEGTAKLLQQLMISDRKPPALRPPGRQISCCSELHGTIPSPPRWSSP